tara:strand:- start:4981 stop:5367 length:387 start_codon:yes stop_codon:yes gene_type:complete
MTVRKLKSSETAGVLKQLVKKQGNVCGICKKPFTAKDYAVLDHCHTSGFIRGALHNSCNGAEGRIKSKAQMGHKGVHPTDYVVGLAAYLTLHKKIQYPLIMHSHKNEDEKRLAKNAKARRTRAKAKKV